MKVLIDTSELEDFRIFDVDTMTVLSDTFCDALSLMKTLKQTDAPITRDDIKNIDKTVRRLSLVIRSIDRAEEFLNFYGIDQAPGPHSEALKISHMHELSNRPIHTILNNLCQRF